jgi:hypothetical protein
MPGFFMLLLVGNYEGLRLKKGPHRSKAKSDE